MGFLGEVVVWEDRESGQQTLQEGTFLQILLEINVLGHFETSHERTVLSSKAMQKTIEDEGRPRNNRNEYLQSVPSQNEVICAAIRSNSDLVVRCNSNNSFHVGILLVPISCHGLLQNPLFTDEREGVAIEEAGLV